MTHTPFVHHGRTGEAVRLCLLNLLLNLATLSLWRFWGRTRVRRLLWGGTSAFGDPVEYTGTGRELMIGFLVVLVVVFLPLMAGFAAVRALEAASSPLAPVLAVALNVLVALLVAAGIYRARRYQLSRTRWRGIRCGLGGSAGRYALLWVAAMAATALSLGWAWPWAQMNLARYRLRHTLFGDREVVCEATAAGLYGRFALVWVSFVPFLAGVGAGAVALFSVANHPTATFVGEVALFYAGLVAWGFVVVALPYAWYLTGFYRNLAEGTRFGDARFSARPRVWPLLRLITGNWLLAGLSLGVLAPVAALRTLRFGCSVIRISELPDFARIRQSTDTGPRAGEGLVSVLDGAGEF